MQSTSRQPIHGDVRFESSFHENETQLSTHNLTIGYGKKQRQTVVQSRLTHELNSGELVCLIGPNGSGKSTLMKTLAGLLKPIEGEVRIVGKHILSYSRHEIAELVALVLTDRVDIENATVWDVVALGQQPYTHWLGGLTTEGHEKIEEAIRLVHLEHKAKNYLNELSDGERQRVMIAKALAQDTPIILLDEPTAHLDLPNRVEIMLLLHRLAQKTRKAILLSTHELDLALQAADRIWLMNDKKRMISGVPEDLVLNGTFNDVFQNDAYFFNTTNGNFSMNYPLTKKVSVSGDKTRMYWTLRALARKGIAVEPNAGICIEITEKGWVVDGKTHPTIENLLETL